MIKQIFFQQPDFIIVDFSDGKTARLNTITFNDLRNRYLDSLKDIKIVPDLVKDQWWSEGTHPELDNIDNVFVREGNYYLAIDDSEEQISPSELKTLLLVYA
ncbi:MAG: hypothetical protein PHD96_01280 [Candidatus Pacebacteria bacterium]|nr:hypothetical protein [Candidatus Paceibacterota bacterium]